MELGSAECKASTFLEEFLEELRFQLLTARKDPKAQLGMAPRQGKKKKKD